MRGRVVSIHRHPVKGFTPERLDTAILTAGGYFPGDRLYAVENGPSGFDPAAPAFTPKSRFTVLASIPGVARARTAYDAETGVLAATAPDVHAFSGNLKTQAGRDAFAAWLSAFLEPEAQRGPLRVVQAPGHRFTDSPDGYVSIVNLESVRDLAVKIGRPVDPLRFRANLYVEGPHAWSELDWAPGTRVRVGEAELTAGKPIVRCLATHVDPETGERDLDITTALRDLYGHLYCGVYLSVAAGGRVQAGDAMEPL
jgi:uncharacterized protein YcbX